MSFFKLRYPGENKHAMLSLRQLDWKASHKSQKTHTLSRGIPEYWCWQRICPVTVVTCKWPEVHVKVGDDLFSTNATSLRHFAQSWNVKCHQRGFEYQVHKSHRVPALEPDSITRKVHKEVQAWLLGAMGNIYRTDILTTINDNWLLVSKCWSKKSTRWESTSQ